MFFYNKIKIVEVDRWVLFRKYVDVGFVFIDKFVCLFIWLVC